MGLIKIRSFPSLPVGGHLRGAEECESLRRHGQGRQLQRPLRPHVRRGERLLVCRRHQRPKGINYIYGLGGRDVRVESIQHVFAELEKIAATGETGETYRYLDVRE